MDSKIWIGVGIAIGLYLLYRWMNPSEEPKLPVDKEIEKIIASDEYKPKGQYD